MQDKHLKLYYFSTRESDVKQVNLGWQKIIGLTSATFALVILVVFLILTAFSDILNDWQISNLSKANSELKDMLGQMENKVQTIEKKVKYIEKNDDDLRIFMDLPEINSDVRQLGRGGQAQETLASYSALAKDGKNEAVEVKQLLDNLSQRVDLAIESRNEITKKYDEDVTRLQHTPSIRPVVGGRVMSTFGRRKDPFTGSMRMHEGIDMAAARGTDVYAPADGVVVEAVTRYQPNNGYGQTILIDHGYGIQTRYGHLSKILVRPGQKITRYTVIGKVGDTGRSTGPHLHYEVINNADKTNPAWYIID
jgi:murein DD-endopeptidase MepM/ murein hydrolase activator NlpD